MEESTHQDMMYLQTAQSSQCQPKTRTIIKINCLPNSNPVTQWLTIMLYTVPCTTNMFGLFVNHCSVETSGLGVKCQHQLNERPKIREVDILFSSSHLLGFEEMIGVQCWIDFVCWEGDDSSLAHVISPACS